LAEVFDVLGAAQVEVGDLWERGVIAVSDEHYATEVTLACITRASEQFRKYRRQPVGFAVLRPAEGEFHNVGLRMLSELLRNEGWETELRISDPPLSMVRELKNRRVNLFCFSATMPSSVQHLSETVRMICKEPSFESAKILVGGRAFNDAGAQKALVAGGTRVDCLASNLHEALEFSRSARS